MNQVKKNKKPKLVILKNIYTKDIFHTLNYYTVEMVQDNIEFIRVFKPENPERTFLVNRQSFQKINK